MTRRVVIAAGVTAAALVAMAVSLYLSTFGATLSSSHEAWGQFGDYFGGLLNPLFAMLAFLALLWSITLQENEFREASKHLSQQAEVARQELGLLRDDRLNQELLHVIKDIDARLEKLLGTAVGVPGALPTLTIVHMVAEAQRLANTSGTSASYSQFIQQARSAGSVVEAPVREMIYLVGKMREFIQEYSRFRSGSYAPIIVYYADKVYQLLFMLEDVGGIPDDTRQFFATVSDGHG